MFKIWAKIIKGEKIQLSLMYKGYSDFETDRLHFYLTEICNELDIPTPVLLKSHIRHFDSFHLTRFTPSDFVEKVDFTLFTIEYVTDNNSEKKHLYKSYLPVD